MDEQNEIALVENANEQLVAPRFLPARALAALCQRQMDRLLMLANIAGVVEDEEIVEEAVAAGDTEVEADMAALVAANENNAAAAVFFQALWALLVWLFGAVVFVLYHGIACMEQICRALPHVVGTVFTVLSNSVQLAWLWLLGSALPRVWGLARLSGVGAIHLIRWLDLAWNLLQVALSRVCELILGWPQLVWIGAIHCLNQLLFRVDMDESKRVSSSVGPDLGVVPTCWGRSHPLSPPVSFRVDMDESKLISSSVGPDFAVRWLLCCRRRRTRRPRRSRRRKSGDDEYVQRITGQMAQLCPVPRRA